MSPGFWRFLARSLGLHCSAIYTRALNRQPAGPPPAGVRVVLGDRQMLDAYVDQPGYGLSREFVASALNQHHEVVLTFKDEQLAAYGWVAYRSAQHKDGWFVDFGEHYRYNYKTLTLPEFRGEHLRGSYGVLEQRDSAEGVTYSIAFIELQNRASIRAEERNGGRRIGYAGYVSLGSLHWSFRTPGVRRAQFRFSRSGDT